MTNIENPLELKAYLLKLGKIAASETIEMKLLNGGVSNRAVLVKRATGNDWVLKQALEKLRVQRDWFSNPERIHREAAGMRYLYQFAPENITPFIFEDKTEHILAMQAVAEPHENWKLMLLRKEIKAQHVQQFAELLALIHRQSFMFQEAKDLFAERSYFETLRLEPYYLYTASQLPEAAEFLEQLVEATRQRLLTLVHGDYSPKNVLVHQDKLILLDHEVIHFGDPAFDIGFALTHLLSKAHHLKDARNHFMEMALYFWHVYAESSKDLAFIKTLETFAIRHTLACLLARVQGLSPLEYLSQNEQMAQTKQALKLMQKEPKSMQELITLFIKGV